MMLSQVTEELVDLLEDVLNDIPKALKGNKSASQRIRAKTIKLGKVAKDWRRISLDLEKKPKKRAARKKKV